MTEDLRFPIGEFKTHSNVTESMRKNWVNVIEESPSKLRAAVSGLSPQQIDTPYRPGGWTVRQVVHHLPDSHINTYSWVRIALTEDEPAIKMYDEKAWAELHDARTAPLEVSLALYEALHARWVLFWKSLPAADYARTFRDPGLGTTTLDAGLDYYAWHCRHHVAHITSLRERMGWG